MDLNRVQTVRVSFVYCRLIVYRKTLGTYTVAKLFINLNNSAQSCDRLLADPRLLIYAMSQ